MSADDLIAAQAARQGPSEWRLAWDRFTGGYGHEPDLTDPADRVAYLQLLRDEVVRAQAAESAAYWRDATAEIERRTERLRKGLSE